MKISDIIKRRLADINMSQVELAEKSGISKIYINKLIKGHATNPSYSVLKSIYDALGLDSSGLVSHDEINMEILQACINGIDDYLLLRGITLDKERKTKLIACLYKRLCHFDMVNASQIQHELDEIKSLI